MYKYKDEFGIIESISKEFENIQNKLRKDILKNIPIGGDNYMKINTYKKENDEEIEYLIHVYVPFLINKEDINIYQVDDFTIEIEYTPKKIEKLVDDGYKPLYQEFDFSETTETKQVKKQITLGNIPIKEIKQKMLQNGVLEIRIKSIKKEKKKKILLD